METSGVLRRRLQAAGHFAISADFLPAEDGSQFPEGERGGHIQDDVFAVLDYLRRRGLWPDAAIFHPDCTNLTNSAAWAYADPDFDRYPGIGYHQRVQPGTLTGGARRAARGEALATVERIDKLDIPKKIVENPIGALSELFREPDQIVQPFMFGDDASKATCLWLWGLDPVPVPPRSQWARPRLVQWKGRTVPRYGNQTDAGQNRLSPGEDRWKDRSRTYPGIGAALVSHIVSERRQASLFA